MTLRLFLRKFFFLCFLIAVPAFADTLDFASFRLQQGVGEYAYDLHVRLPSVRTVDEAIELPNGCVMDSHGRSDFSSELLLDYGFHCSHGLSPDAVIRVPWGSDGGVWVSELERGQSQSRMLRGSDAGLVLPVGESIPRKRALWEIALEYTQQGVLHILQGFDHLSFVLCLCLLARRRELFLLVTSFTLGHSISLALAYFGLIHVQIPPTETAIALSIAFMAREAVLSARKGVHLGGGANEETRLRYLVVVVAFGLLHGLGFASALGELGIGGNERIAGLVFFNVGVEIGQLLFVACVMLVMGGMRMLHSERPARFALLGVAGSVGAFWAIQRLASFLLP